MTQVSQRRLIGDLLYLDRFFPFRRAGITVVEGEKLIGSVSLGDCANSLVGD